MAQLADGWMPGVDQVRTQAFSYPGMPEDSMYPQVVVNHVASGYYTTLRQMMASTNHGKSWHFSVSRLGEITQHVSIWDAAYHAGDVNTPTTDWMQRLGDANPNYFSVGIECEGFSIPAPGMDYVYGPAHPWPEPMVAAVIRIHQWVWSRCSWLQVAIDTAARVTTHSEYNTVTRPQDPGDFWIATVRPRIIAALSPTPIPPLPPVGPSDDYKQGWQDMKAAAGPALQAALDSVEEPWE